MFFSLASAGEERKQLLCGVQTSGGMWCERLLDCSEMNSGTRCHPLLVCAQTAIDLEAQPIRLLLRVGIKVVDEWQISLGYARGPNIYVRGYLDLRAWSLRLRT